MKKLCKKSTLLTRYLEFLLQNLNSTKINIITPRESVSRGCQISIEIIDANKKFHESLTDLGVITDWRDPNVIRCAPTPLYNSFVEVYLFVEKLKLLI